MYNMLEYQLQSTTRYVQHTGISTTEYSKVCNINYKVQQGMYNKVCTTHGISTTEYSKVSSLFFSIHSVLGDSIVLVMPVKSITLLLFIYIVYVHLTMNSNVKVNKFQVMCM